ncbi:uncharacterized protein BT62DRAFT_1004793 [Guyanagaster necrorhizus]|uniref:DUF6534 domain-containing protein n=1 Tax=Guyanagaster necrorhizus TaxID=856835 RepID=A0A9P8ATH9_9AGAR|nr:uncharacterized protein BT62DRAFT_1004793 [Guyanagaster necrorhizus MCA 3950]KAG7447215.1 hypothetical protein BT62DRAFT_1004793 [Guyanagaster necrorhizus MCA 3950]
MFRRIRFLFFSKVSDPQIPHVPAAFTTPVFPRCLKFLPSSVTAMAPVEIPGVNVPLLKRTGPLALGYMWDYGLYGILLVQMYIYHITFRKDKIGFKIFGAPIHITPIHPPKQTQVWSLLLLETVFTIFTTIAAWHNFGTGWGDPDTLTTIDVSWEPLPALNGFIAAMVQSFYVYRIWTLTKKLWLALAIEAVALMQCILAFYYGIVVSLRGRGINELFALAPSINACLSGSAACNVLITASIVTILYKSETKVVFSHTTNTVTQIIRYVVETGLVTSVVALCELVLWLTNRQYNFHFIGFLILGKLYANTALGIINSRALMFSGHQQHQQDYEHQSTFVATTPHNTTSYWDESESIENDLSSIYQHQPGPSIPQPVQVFKTVSVGQSTDSLDTKNAVVSNFPDHSERPSAASTSAGTFIE